MSWIDNPDKAPASYEPIYSRPKKGFFRPHDPDLGAFDNADRETGEVFPSMTRQSEMEACDIHNVLRQFSQQGFEQLVREKAATGQYADLPDELDYQSALNTVLAAQASFATLPSQVRERFHNNPGEFLEFLSDSANQDEAIRLGLAQDTRPKEEDPMKVTVVNYVPPEPKEPKGG